MTIGIVTRGPQAGAAAMQILRATEAVGSGAIGGFAVLRWRRADGSCGEATCQDLGSLGLQPGSGWAEASHAAIISSGPNRPEPLGQFIAIDPQAGFVTGHRLPTSALPDGRPINQAALALMTAGRADAAALQALLAQGPAMDAGLICLPWDGPVVMGNAPRVESRSDVGAACHEAEGRAVAILHNSIHTATLAPAALAPALLEIGMEAMGAAPGRHRLAVLPDRLPVHRAAQDAVEIDAEGRALALHSADPAYFSDRPRITAVYQAVPVLCAGQRVGHAISEVFAALEPGVLTAGPRRHFLWVQEG